MSDKAPKLGNALAATLRRRSKELGSIKLLAGEVGLGVANTQRMLSAGGAYQPRTKTLIKLKAWTDGLKKKGSKADKPDKRRKSGKRRKAAPDKVREAARKPRSTKTRTVIPATFSPAAAGRTVKLTEGRVTIECDVRDVGAVIQQLRT